MHQQVMPLWAQVLGLPVSSSPGQDLPHTAANQAQILLPSPN